MILDTRARLWWRTADEELSGGARPEIARAERIGACTISCSEAARAAARGRIAPDRGSRARIRLVPGDERIESLERTAATAAEAGALGTASPAVRSTASSVRRRSSTEPGP